MKPSFYLDNNLRFQAEDIEQLEIFVLQLLKDLKRNLTPEERTSQLGKAASYFIILNKLDQAEALLLEALKIIAIENLGIKKEIQQKIRLAHVLQHKKDFTKSNLLFSELLNTCLKNSDAAYYLDFAYQHAGKNLFDQNKFEAALGYFNKALELRLNKNAPDDQIESTQKAISITKQRMNI